MSGATGAARGAGPGTEKTDKNAAAFNGSSLPVRSLTGDERRRGARYAAARAADAGDLRLLLEALGLDAADGLPHRTGMRGAP